MGETEFYTHRIEGKRNEREFENFILIFLLVSKGSKIRGAKYDIFSLRGIKGTKIRGNGN